jgi:hypothetical protein
MASTGEMLETEVGELDRSDVRLCQRRTAARTYKFAPVLAAPQDDRS